MRRILLLSFFLFAALTATYAQTLSDTQVIEYVQNAKRQGKNDKQISLELAQRGVTKEQAQRLKSKYESMPNAEVSDETASRVVRKGIELSTPEELQQDDEFIPDTARVEEPAIYGHNLFVGSSTFNPSTNLATPKNYILGPGDEVVIDVWGSSENTIRQTITPEGDIKIPNLGPISLSGLTIGEAQEVIQREFSKIYSGISGKTSELRLTLGQNRSIQINVMGEVNRPGTYQLSSFASVFHALYAAGGVNRIGSLRQVKLVRQGQTVSTIDLYQFILKGKYPSRYKLEEGDVLIIPAYASLVSIEGEVKRPMLYELSQGETLASLLEYAGGFTGKAYKKSVQLVRQNGVEQEVYTLEPSQFSVFKMADQDSVYVSAVLDRFTNAVELQGAVYRPGLYELGGDILTLKDLLMQADGLKGDAFLNRVLIRREREDLTHEMLSINLANVLKGIEVDVPLQRNDVVYIPSKLALNEKRTLTIHGQVAQPGVYDYTDNMCIEDLIIQAGGLLESASAAKIDISRRIKNPYDTTESNQLGETFTLELAKDYLGSKEGLGFVLEPYDEVYVRKSPNYEVQQNVTISGEILFAGSYPLEGKNQRLSDLIRQAGGLTSDAYLEGARLVRQMTKEERLRQADLLALAQKKVGKSDSIDVATLEVDETYSVGINLPAALKKPQSDADLVLREGDVLFIPRFESTVKINGAVMYPNTVVFAPGKTAKYYIEQAGGYALNAKKSKAYVIYMNGQVARLKKNKTGLIRPGCEIVVPTKDEKQRMSTGEIISLGTSAASLAAIIASLVSLFK